MAIDLGVSDAQAALLPGILALSESAGKVVSGRIISYYRDSTLHLYQGAWLGMSLSSFACPFSKSFVGLGLYAVFWGFCVGNATGSHVGVIHYLVGRKRVVRAYSIFRLGLSPSVLAGPPIAGMDINNEFYLHKSNHSAHAYLDILNGAAMWLISLEHQCF